MDDPTGVHRGQSGGHLPQEGTNLRQAELDPVTHQTEQVMLEIIEDEDEVVPAGIALGVDHLAQSDHIGVDALSQVRDFPEVRQTQLLRRPLRRRSSTKCA